MCDRGDSVVLCGPPGLTCTPTMALTVFLTCCEAGALHCVSYSVPKIMKPVTNTGIYAVFGIHTSANTAIKATKDSFCISLFVFLYSE